MAEIWRLTCPTCKYFNSEEGDYQALLCGVNPDGPDKETGFCPQYEYDQASDGRTVKSYEKVNYTRSDHVASVRAREILNQHEIQFLQQLAQEFVDEGVENPLVTQHHSSGILFGLYLDLRPKIGKGNAQNPFNRLVCVERLKALKRQGIQKLYLDLSGS